MRFTTLDSALMDFVVLLAGASFSTTLRCSGRWPEGPGAELLLKDSAAFSTSLQENWSWEELVERWKVEGPLAGGVFLPHLLLSIPCLLRHSP